MFKKRTRGQFRRQHCNDVARQQYDKPVNLDALPVGATGIVMAITGERKLRRRLMEMGLLEGSRLRVVKFAPGGDPVEIKVNDYFLSLRRSEAARIVVLPKSAATMKGDKS
jgi:Fe2+ transport system protein FeoA